MPAVDSHMDDQPDGGQIDNETLQAPSTANASRMDSEKELQEYMRRPPRLGVGAPVPSSSSVTRETAKLKSRLAGSRGSKRPRDDEVSNEHLSADDEDEESRVSVVKKKVKLDPFAMPKSKKQSKAENNTTNKPSSKISAPQTVALDDTESKVPPRSMQTNGVSRDNDAVSTSRKKRKKKRHRFSETTTTGAQEASVPNTNSQPLPVAAHTSDLEAHLNGPTNFAPTDSASALPLLNLDGPPSININGEDTSGPKKRKRRRKKKGSANDATVDV